MNPAFWSGKKVFLTGHTGFKGCWAALWLLRLGAQVYGYARPPATDPSLYDMVGLGSRLDGESLDDVCNRESLDAALKAASPDIIVHMAAQALVRLSYREPIETFSTNVIGTANLLQSARGLDALGAILVVTTDKCYENNESGAAFVEADPLGGRDPYSASKACQEIVTAAMRDSYFEGAAGIATARAGNVVGGGDWAEDRLVPDIVRAAEQGASLVIRYPEAVRPWQYVLDPVAGYLSLAEALYRDRAAFAGGWNFAPAAESAVTVRTVIEAFARHYGELPSVEVDDAPRAHEAHFLRLDATKARRDLGWRPRCDLQETMRETADWYRSVRDGASPESACDAALGRMSD